MTAALAVQLRTEIEAAVATQSSIFPEVEPSGPAGDGGGSGGGGGGGGAAAVRGGPPEPSPLQRRPSNFANQRCVTRRRRLQLGPLVD